MKIPRQLIEYYLSAVTVNYFNDHDIAPQELAGYDEYVDDIRRWAERRGDMASLKVAFEHLLASPEVDCGAFWGGRYDFDDREIRQILDHAYRRLWPDAGDPPASSEIPVGPAVELVNLPIEDWWAQRGDGASTTP